MAQNRRGDVHDKKSHQKCMRTYDDSGIPSDAELDSLRDEVFGTQRQKRRREN